MRHKERFNELKDAGLRPEPYPDRITNSGFLVNGKFVVGGIKNRWRVKGRAKWYYFRDIEHFKSIIEND